MSSPSKNIVESESVVEEDIGSPDNNDDDSASAEIYEAARQLEDLEESKKLLDNASDADVSNFSSSDSIQTIIEGDILQNSGAGSSLQRSPKQIFRRIKLEDECKDESSDEACSKLTLKKSPRQGKKSPKKPVDQSIQVADSDAGCSTVPREVSEHGSRTTILDSDKEEDCEQLNFAPVKISVQDMDSSDKMPGKPCEVTTKKRISKKSPEKFKKTRLGSSEIAADIIEDAVDPTDDSVFTTVGSSDFLTANYPNSAIVNDLTEDAIDNTDQVVFTKVSSDPAVSEEICDAGLVTDENVPLDHTDRATDNQAKSLDPIASDLSTLLHREAIPQPQIPEQNEEQTGQVEVDSKKHGFQESLAVDDPSKVNIFGQVTQIEGGHISDKNTEFFNPQNIDFEKTESSCGSEPSDEKMEFSNASTIPSGIGCSTDVEKMDYSSDTYSELENFKIDGDSNVTLEKMECKSESSASHDKMDTESLSLKSNETESMEFSSESASNFDKTSTAVQENESIGVLVYESTSGQTEPTNVHENDFTSLQESESFKVEENKSMDDQENTHVGVQGIESISHQEKESISTQEYYAVEITESSLTNVQETDSAIVQENKSTNMQETECISDLTNKKIIVQENISTSVPEKESTSVSEYKPIDISQVEEDSNPIPESLSCLIGDFVSRTINRQLGLTVSETLSRQPRDPISCLIDISTIGQSLINRKSSDSDSNSNEIKAIYESSIDANTGTGRKFGMPHKESSDTENYELEKTQVCDQKAIDKKPGDTSLKRKSLEEKVREATDIDKQSTSSAAELPDNDKVEFEDTDDKKGNKKLKK